MSTSTSNLNPETTSLDTITIGENLSYLAKFGLFPNVTQHIDTCLIFHNVHIDDPTTTSDIEFNLWILMCLKNYQFSQTLVIHRMLKVFRNEFHRWGYTEFNRLDRHIRSGLKETFMARRIYISIANGHVNQRLANLITDDQLPVWDKTELLEYKSIYPTSKVWVLLELQHSYLSRQISPSIEENFNLINNRRQQTFTPEPSNIIPNPANAFGSIPPIYQLTITPVAAQIGATLPADLSQKPSNASANSYTQIPPISVPNKILPATIIA